MSGTSNNINNNFNNATFNVFLTTTNEEKNNSAANKLGNSRSHSTYKNAEIKNGKLMMRPSFINEKQALRFSEQEKVKTDRSKIQIDQFHLYNPSE